MTPLGHRNESPQACLLQVLSVTADLAYYIRRYYPKSHLVAMINVERLCPQLEAPPPNGPWVNGCRNRNGAEKWTASSTNLSKRGQKRNSWKKANDPLNCEPCQQILSETNAVRHAISQYSKEAKEVRALGEGFLFTCRGCRREQALNRHNESGQVVLKTNPGPHLSA